MSAPNERVSDWLLERLVAGELDEAHDAEVRARLGREVGGMDRLEALLQSNREILADHPPASVVAEIQRRRAGALAVERAAADARVRSNRGVRLGLLGLPLAGAVALLALYAIPKGADGPADEYIGIKGGGVVPKLRVYRKDGERAALLAEGALVRPHDTLQIAYVPAGRPYGAVVSLDGRGVVTFHLPESAGPSPTLADGREGEVPLPHAYELDAAPGFERFVFVTARRPFDVQDVARALRAGQPLPAELTQTVFNVRKESP